MVAIIAEEVFYSRLEAEYSLSRKSGYQVVYHSPGLSAALVREIETQLRCFDGKQIDIRYQFFHLSNGKIAIAASQMLEEIDTRIIDRAGRSGPFIAHCLVIDAASFETLGANPFSLIDSADPFVLDVPQMIEAQQRSSENRVIEIDIPDADGSVDYLSFDIQDWTLAEFIALWQAAADVRAILDRNQVVGLQSEEEADILALLRLLFAHLDVQTKAALTFNSFADNCQPMMGVYWALGGFKKVSMSNAIHMRLDRRKVNYLSQRPNSDIEDLASTVFQQLRAAQGLDQEQNSQD